MKPKKTLSVMLLLTSMLSVTLHGQDEKLLFLDAEAGFYSFGNEIKDLNFIRQSASDYDYYGDYAYDMSGYFTSAYAGIKLEKEIISSRLSILTGIRYTRFTSLLGDTESGNSGYIYLLYKNEGLNTEFLKANGILQNSDFLGIPFEMKYYISHYHFVRSFLRLGGTVNFQIQSKEDIIFSNSAMEVYNDEMASRLGKPETFNALGYAGFGLRIGKENKPSLSIEAHIPVGFLTDDAFTFAKPIAGGGIQLNVSIPLSF